jgi:hypothetical protein
MQRPLGSRQKDLVTLIFPPMSSCVLTVQTIDEKGRFVISQVAQQIVFVSSKTIIECQRDSPGYKAILKDLYWLFVDDRRWGDWYR